MTIVRATHRGGTCFVITPQLPKLPCSMTCFHQWKAAPGEEDCISLRGNEFNCARMQFMAGVTRSIVTEHGWLLSAALYRQVPAVVVSACASTNASS